jgi:hypothetical protein
MGDHKRESDKKLEEHLPKKVHQLDFSLPVVILA